jgi:hypothetical protein
LKINSFIAHGTGFIWNHKEKQYLITNWHNLTGQNPFTGKHLSPGGKVPDYGYEKIFTNVGSDLFIVGYPFSEFDEFKLPIWKKGSLASETFAIWNRKPAFLIDAASRRGMSGSPIIRRVFGPASVWINRKLTTNLDAVCTSEFIGIYFGHLHTNHADVTIGISWYANLIDELLSAPHDGSRLFQA